VANTLAAARAGATQLECTINGIGERAGNAALEEVVMAIHTRKDIFGLECRVDTRQISRASRLVSTLIGVPVPPNKAIVGANAFAHEAGIHQHGVLCDRTTYEIMTPASIGLEKNRMVLGKHSGRHAFEDRLRQMGYQLEENRVGSLFAKFKKLADKKKDISDRDLEALVLSGFNSNHGVYHLDRFNINSSHVQATADIRLIQDEEYREARASGDGTMDAAFKALEKIVGGDHVLEDFFIHAVTEGRDAQGEVRVKLRRGTRSTLGKGLSTDVVEAGILAYVHAVNRLMHPGEGMEESL
jgi:2-isopropylmalate synthase